MDKKRTYFPRTTAQQRRLLFEVWEATGDVGEACRRAHVCERTFYRWKPRFDAGGYGALEEFQSHAPKNPRRKPKEVEEKVIAMRRQHGDWGKKRISHELAKDNNWVPLASPNTVRRILEDAGLWPEPEATAKEGGSQPAVRAAEEPGQTLNVDLCFVPATHEAQEKLPAVSGSSGRLVVEQPKEEQAEKDWPGRVFEDESRDYSEAMLDFVAASQAQSEPVAAETTMDSSEKTSLKAQKRALRQEEEELRAERRVVRQQRKQEDDAWRQMRAERKQEKEAQAGQSTAERKAQDERWRALRQQRQETVARHKQEDAEWRQQRHRLREMLAQLPIVTAWIAILVITDNCTRLCLGLPLFVVGPKVTAEMVVEALRVLLPPELQFLISDRGTHFTAKVFQQLARHEAFIHVLIARHRPQSNGIAERFVRTLKEWLRDKTWANDEELAALIEQFIAEYNDRPHQGLPIPGLSPNEFANRIWLM